MFITIGAEWRPTGDDQQLYVSQEKNEILGMVIYRDHLKSWLAYISKLGDKPVDSARTYTLEEAKHQVELFVQEDTELEV